MSPASFLSNSSCAIYLGLQTPWLPEAKTVDIRENSQSVIFPYSLIDGAHKGRGGSSPATAQQMVSPCIIATWQLSLTSVGSWMCSVDFHINRPILQKWKDPVLPFFFIFPTFAPGSRGYFPYQRCRENDLQSRYLLLLKLYNGMCGSKGLFCGTCEAFFKNVICEGQTYKKCSAEKCVKYFNPSRSPDEQVL